MKDDLTAEHGTTTVRLGGGLHTVYRARKRHACGWACGTPIEAGQLYVRSVLPPSASDNEWGGWMYHALHGHHMENCPTFVHGDPALGVDVESNR